MQPAVTRRGFLAQSLTSASVAWVSAHWPAILAAADYAHAAAQSSSPAKFEFFTSEQAAEIDAITARIIPTTDTPGAHEAGVVYFIDRSLVTFNKDNQKIYKDGLLELDERLSEMFPGTKKFSAATPDQQDEVLQSLDDQAAGGRRRNLRPRPAAQTFFETIRVDAIVAFLVDPDSGGNRDGVGWKVIGRDLDHMFQPPFGYYDKDYPGWQPNPPGKEKNQ